LDGPPEQVCAANRLLAQALRAGQVSKSWKGLHAGDFDRLVFLHSEVQFGKRGINMVVDGLRASEIVAIEDFLDLERLAHC
jgi:hypothetical protein